MGKSLIFNDSLSLYGAENKRKRSEKRNIKDRRKSKKFRSIYISENA